LIQFFPELPSGPNYTERPNPVNAGPLPSRRKTRQANEIRSRDLDRLAASHHNYQVMPIRPVPAPFKRPIRLGVLISGGGSTLTNFIEKITAGELAAEVPLVIASRADCGGVARARNAGLRCEIVDRKAFSSVAEFSQALFDLCRTRQVDLVTLAGFLSLIEVPDDFLFRVMNIHPALIPAFCGKGFYGHRVHEAVLRHGVKVSGCTVHFADNHYDQGPIIVQSCVSVHDLDTPETLAARVFAAECQAYPEGIRLYAAGRLEIHDRRVHVLPVETGRIR
jgi:phosphoribosylglycinamide formyltransferase-1